MNKKKIGLIVVVLFLLIGLGSFVFANPNEEENLKKKGKDVEESETAGDKDSEESATDEQTDATDEQVLTSDNNAVRTNNITDNAGNTGNTGNAGDGTGGTGVVDDSYNRALEAVKKAESSFTQDDVNNAKVLVDKVTDPDGKKELQERLDAVQNVIDASKIVTELENKVNSSNNISDMNGARDYRTETEIEKIVSELKDGSYKDKLEERLETIGKILNDNARPIITGIDDNSFVRKDVTLTIEDANDVTTKVTLDGKEIEYTGTFTEEGTYVVTVVDEAFNEATKTFTIDKTNPVVGGVEDGKYYNTDVAVTIDDANPGTIHLKKDGVTVKPYKPGDILTEEGTYTVYVSDKAGNKSKTITFVIDKHVEDAKWVYILNLSDKNNRKTIRDDQTLRVEVNFDEKLTKLPVLTIGNSQSTEFRKCSETDYGKYVCVADLTIDNTIANLEDGEIPFTITNIYDKAGNTITLDNANVTETKEYGQLTYDGSAPVVKSLGITDLNEFKDEVGKLYAKNGDTVRVLVYFDEKLGTEPTVKLGGKEFTATYRKDSPKYSYYADIKLTEDMNLNDGILPFEVYGYADVIGNVGVNLTEKDVNNTTYPSVTIDNTLPELNFHNGFITSGYTVEVTDDNFAYMTVQYYDGRETETIKSNTFTLDKEGDNTRYNIKAYDKAGNVSEYRDIYLDNNAPSISSSVAINGGKKTTLENNGIYQKVTLNISDGSLKKVVLVKDDGIEEVLATYEDNFKNIKLTFEKEYTEEGTYTVKAIDRNKNESTITFTIDKTPATRVYSTLDFDKSGKQYYEINKEKVFYVKNEDSFVFRMQFSEELKTAPTVKVGGMTVPMTLNEKFLNNEGKYIYEGTVNITDEAKLEEGRLEVILSNVVDMAGNESTDEVVLNQTPTSNGRVAVYDKTVPSATKVQIINNSNPNSEYIKNGETVRVRATFNEKLATAPVLTIGNYTATFKNVGDGKGNDLYSADITIDNDESELKEGKLAFTITGYTDLAGNAGDKATEDSVKTNITYDRTSAKVEDLIVHSSYSTNNAYGKVGNSFGIYLITSEELRENPTFTVNGKEYKVNQTETNGGRYKYAVVYDITDEMDEGVVKFVISNIYDKAGNKTEDLTEINGDQKLIIDNTMPKVSIGGSTGSKNWHKEQDIEVKVTEANIDNIYYAFNASSNDGSMHRILDSEKAIKVDKKDIIDNGDGTYTTKIHLATEGRYVLNIKVVDKAGNITYTRRGWYQIDRTDPTIVLHKDKNSEEIKPGVHNYCVSATISDKNLKSTKLNGKDYKSDDFICDDGNHTLVATDKAGNSETIGFKIDRTYPVITINGVNYTGDTNDAGFFNNIDLKLTEVNNYTAWVNDKEVDLTTYDFNKNGNYKVKVVDEASNNTTVNFTVDTIPVALVNIRVNSTNTNKDVAKVGDKIGIYLNVDEELKEDPIFTVNGKEYANVKLQKEVNGTHYKYALLFNVTDDMPEGEVQFTISNIYDKAGNKLDDLSNANTEEKVVIDKTAPTISINNWKDLTFQIGDTYEDEGATATDNIDGDITDKIEVSYLYYDENGKRVNPDPKEIKFDRVGEFVIKYIATDRAGNRREATRSINVVEDNEDPVLTGVESGQEYYGSIYYEMSDNSGSFKLYYDLSHNYQTCEELIANGELVGTIYGSYTGYYQVPGDYDSVSVCLVDKFGNTTFRNNIKIRVF